MAWLKALLATLLVLAALVVGLCFGLHAMGASRLPDDLAPSRYRAPSELRALYLKVEVGDVADVPRLNPVSVWGYWLWHFSGKQREPLGAQLRLLGHAGRRLVVRQSSPSSATRWHLTNLAASVHVSRHWSRDDMVDTVLAEAWFGRNAKSIEQAAQVWYGRPIAALVREERLLLIALMKSPSYYDPACRPERFAERYRHVAARAGGIDPDAALPRALARLSLQACPDRR
jgi:hypothetical protein